MKIYDVTFYCSDDDHYKKRFEAKDIDNLVAFINEQKYIHIPGQIHDIKMKRWKSHTIIYSNSIRSLSIDEVIYEDNSYKDSIDFNIL